MNSKLNSLKNYLPSESMIPLFAVHMPEDVDQPLLEALHSGYIGQGPKVEQFESLLAEYIGSSNLLTVNAGTSALHLALRLIGVDGGEVITTPMTCTATNMPILANGGKIVWADINSRTGLIDPLDIERKITDNTKAIMVVDWGGTPVDMTTIMDIGERYGLKVIEDAAHAFGAKFGGKRVGLIADYTIFSFQAIKHITTVDGGLLVCKDSSDYRRGKLMRWYGIDRETDKKDFRCEEDIEEWGYKFHMNDIAAVIGICQLKYVDQILKKHRDNARYYFENLNRDFYTLPTDGITYNFESSFWLYTLTLPTKELRVSFMEYMQSQGILVSQVHARNDKHTAFNEFARNLPGVEEFTQKMVCIPVHWRLTEDQREKIVKAVNTFSKRLYKGPTVVVPTPIIKPKVNGRTKTATAI